VDLLAALLEGLGNRRANTSPFVAEQRQQTDSGAAQLPWHINVRGHVERGEDHRKADDQHHARPHNLPRADVEVHARHPDIGNRQRDQAGSNQQPRIHPRPMRIPMMIIIMIANTPEGDRTRPAWVAS